MQSETLSLLLDGGGSLRRVESGFLCLLEQSAARGTMESGEIAVPRLTSCSHPRRNRPNRKTALKEQSMILRRVATNFKSEALTDEQLRLEAPSIFANAPMIGLSQRYAFVPTTEIVLGLREKSWLPVSAEQQRVRTSARIGFQKHLIRFRRAEQMKTLDEWNEELVLTNSHDAGCAYLIQVGIYRRLCSNGLVVSDSTFEAIRFRHAGLKPEAVVEASYRILDYVPKVAVLINDFRNRHLTDSEMTTFAEQALLLRFEDLDCAPIEPRTLLMPRRLEDQGSDVWTTLNRIQENLMRGGLSDNRHTRAGRLRSLRSLRGIDSQIALNKGLWGLAERIVNHLN